MTDQRLTDAEVAEQYLARRGTSNPEGFMRFFTSSVARARLKHPEINSGEDFENWIYSDLNAEDDDVDFPDDED